MSSEPLSLLVPEVLQGCDSGVSIELGIIVAGDSRAIRSFSLQRVATPEELRPELRVLTTATKPWN